MVLQAAVESLREMLINHNEVKINIFICFLYLSL